MVLEIMTTGGALNAKILEVETEKIAKSTWSDKILNSNPAIFYGIEDVATVSNVGAAAKSYRIFVEIVLVNSGQTNDTSKRINRYARALEELFSANFAPAVGFGQVKIEQVRPISFKLELDSSEEIIVGGISLTMTLV